MAVKPVLRMGDPRLLLVSAPVREFGTAQLRELITDMEDTMRAAGGAGLAAPQIGVLQRGVIFGGGRTERYPDADAGPSTVLINPKLKPSRGGKDGDWAGGLGRVIGVRSSGRLTLALEGAGHGRKALVARHIARGHAVRIAQGSTGDGRDQQFAHEQIARPAGDLQCGVAELVLGINAFV